MKKIAILSCDVFEEELKHIMQKHSISVPVYWLEMGLHDNPNNLRTQIMNLIAMIESTHEIDAIVLLYGMCGNGLVDVYAERSSLVIARAHDCISILLNSRTKQHEILSKNPGTYFYSPGWIRGKRVPGPDREAKMREDFAEKYEDDPEMIDELIEVDQENFEHYNCAAYVDVTDNKEAQSYCQKCAHTMDWSYQRLEGNIQLLADLVIGNWENDNILIIPPKHKIVLSNGDELIKAEEM